MSKIQWPFLGAEALAARAIPERTMRKAYEPVYPGGFVPRGVALNARHRATAAWLWSRRRGRVVDTRG